MRTLLAPTPEPSVAPVEASTPARALDVPAALIAACVVALGCALQINFGQYHPLALAWLTVALIGVAVCVAWPSTRAVRRLERRAVPVVLGCLVIHLSLLLTRGPGATGILADTPKLPFVASVVGIALIVAVRLIVGHRSHVWMTIALLAAYAAAGLWVLRAAPQPALDVCLFQQEACDALLRGENPYAITFGDPYADSSRFYGPGVSVGGRLQFGYPYPPLSLLLALPGHLLGDFRYAQLLAMTVAGGLIAFARPGRMAFAAAALLLTTPRGFFVLEAGWTEPLAVMLLAATLFAACRSGRSLVVPLGLLAAVKQYLVLGLPLVLLLRRPRRLWWGSILVASAMTLPMALWDVKAFVRSVILLQFRQPFREDALSYLVPLGHVLGVLPAWWICFIAAGLATALVLRRAPRTPAGFTLGLGLVLLAFFAFNKQAFCNYYHLVIGALCCSISAVEPRPAGQDE